MLTPCNLFRLSLFSVMALCCFAIAQARSQQTMDPPYYEEEVSSSDPLRTEQARELDAYILRLKNDETRLHELFQPNYTSVKAYEASTRKMRQVFAESIGYPPPGKPDPDPPQFTKLGEDKIGTYYRASIPVLPGIHTIGLYIIPKVGRGPFPLIVSMHGGGGSPEVATFHGGANYHGMVRGGVERGYIVWAPTHLFQAVGYPNDIRNRIDERARLVGTSVTAIEIAKITRSLDVLVKRPEVDPTRIGMVGLSYGGYYTLVTTALEPRIKAAVCSGYFGVQEGRYERDEMSVPSDFRFMNRFTLLKDSEIVALICPRPLQIQAGSQDDTDHRDPGLKLAVPTGEYYRRLGRSGEFQSKVFQGGHEFNDDLAWTFISKYIPVTAHAGRVNP